jgi:sugar-phosphatase
MPTGRLRGAGLPDWKRAARMDDEMTNPLLPDRAFGALLFDMDGTLLTSILAAERIWRDWAAGHGIDVEGFLPTIHGMRTIETVKRWAPLGLDAEIEAAGITAREMADVEGVAAITGAAAFLAALPAGRWAIVTSAPRALAMRRLEATGLPLPQVVITSEDVDRGKPAPDCFLLAAKRLGVPIGDCLVFEDAPAGVAAAEAAGASVVVVTATHTQPLATPHRTVKGYDGLVAAPEAGGLRLQWRR